MYAEALSAYKSRRSDELEPCTVLWGSQPHTLSPRSEDLGTLRFGGIIGGMEITQLGERCVLEPTGCVVRLPTKDSNSVDRGVGSESLAVCTGGAERGAQLPMAAQFRQ